MTRSESSIRYAAAAFVVAVASWTVPMSSEVALAVTTATPAAEVEAGTNVSGAQQTTKIGPSSDPNFDESVERDDNGTFGSASADSSLTSSVEVAGGELTVDGTSEGEASATKTNSKNGPGVGAGARGRLSVSFDGGVAYFTADGSASTSANNRFGIGCAKVDLPDGSSTYVGTQDVCTGSPTRRNATISASGFTQVGALVVDGNAGGSRGQGTAPGTSNGSFDWEIHLTVRPCDLMATAGVPLDGTSGNDVICGSSGDDEIDGLGGDDVIFGAGGDDTLIGNEGTDEIDGGDGDDTLQGFDDTFGEATGENGDFIRGGSGDDTISGSGDADFIVAEGGIDTIEGGAGNDALDAGPGVDPENPNRKDLVFGMCLGCTEADLGPGESDFDTLVGGFGPDRLLGGPDIDSIFGGAGNDELDGEEGDEVDLSGPTPDPRLDGGPGNDKILGGPGDDFGSGGTGNDNMKGQGGKDKLRGDEGSDDLDGGPAKDVLEGGDQNDSINSRDCIEDKVRGGPGGNDTAKIDELDDVTGIEGAVGINC